MARFFNHSCEPCLETTAVVLPGDNGVTYRIAMFASRTIPPLEELTWDYSEPPYVIQVLLIV